MLYECPTKPVLKDRSLGWRYPLTVRCPVFSRLDLVFLLGFVVVLGMTVVAILTGFVVFVSVLMVVILTLVLFDLFPDL